MSAHRLDPPQRNTLEWYQWVAKTGRWNAHPYWRDPDYLMRSPWPADTVDQAFEALAKVFPPPEVTRYFEPGHPLFQLIADPWSPHLSPLLHLGLDAMDARPWRHGSLLRRLRQHEEYEGARFELELLAACRRASMPCEYEPLRALRSGRPKPGERRPNPDLGIKLAKYSLLIDAKLLRTSFESSEETSWLEAIGLIWDGPSVVKHIELMERFGSLQDSELGRTWIRHNLQDLRIQVLLLAERLGNSATLPATDYVLDNAGHPLVKVTVEEKGRAGGSALGIATNARRETQRLRSRIEHAGAQFPPGTLGIAILGIAKTPRRAAEREVIRWFSEQGDRYKEVIGVVLVGEIFRAGTLQSVVPVWSTGAPRTIARSTFWSDFAIAMNYVHSAVARYTNTFRPVFLY